MEELGTYGLVNVYSGFCFVHQITNMGDGFMRACDSVATILSVISKVARSSVRMLRLVSRWVHRVEMWRRRWSSTHSRVRGQNIARNF